MAASVLVLLTICMLLGAVRGNAEPLHVRGLTSTARIVIAEGLKSSPSFRDLVERLNQSDVVVYVKEDHYLPRTLSGQLTFQSMAGRHRYVMVRLAWLAIRTQQIASLGHELQHAIEIADRPGIISEAALGHEYAQLVSGKVHAHGARRAYETNLAQRAGDRVWRELHGHAR
jgi:hypothetical protein